MELVFEQQSIDYLRQKLLMLSLFDDVAVFHDENDVRFTDGRKPMCNDKARPALHHLGKGMLDLQLGSRIDGACCLV